MYQTIRYEKVDNIGIATISRPEALNALNETVISELEQLLTVLEADADLGALIITGDGRAFVAGADIVYQQSLDVLKARKFGQRGSAVMRRIELLTVPTIAAVNGFALGGGCELAMSCDIIVASEKAKFGQPEVSLGITAGFSGTQRLPRRVGTAVAKELLFSGKMIAAAEAKEIGLVNHVYAPEALMDSAMDMAKSFTKNAPIAVKFTKNCVERGMQMDMDSAIALENELYSMCFATDDQTEGMTAFMEKRTAEFKNQ
ncbi:enoyl-CoA hydratase-related protein [Bengtsoniella intestinalis]|uniref:enoyl-CoA hydratase-related protein n=1 Tax=Bengtsoniella intestinalis TaxID=3073143 RepID=UPI00391F4C00